MNNFKESLKVNLDKPVERLTPKEAKKTYEEFVIEQKEQFVLFINYLNRYINSMREKGIVSPFLEFRARIKSTDSALKNYEEKALDDTFGIEFICASEKEIEIIKQEMKKMLTVYKEKVHNKDNGYKAIHHSCGMKEELTNELNKIARKQNMKPKINQQFPMIEVQYKTVEVAYQAIYGTASHEKYKSTKIPQLQSLYDNNNLLVGEYIPNMWISDLHNDDMVELSTNEILKRMYPSLVLSKTDKDAVIDRRS